MAWFAAAVPLIAGIGTAVTVATTVAQSIGQQKIAQYNAKLSEQAEAAEQQQANREEESLRRNASYFLGKQRAAIAEAGLSPGGTTGMLADQSAALAELDALNIRYGGQMRGRGLLSEASNERLAGRAGRSQGLLLAGAQLLSGASDTYRMSKLKAA
jgi:hypothetical protein